VPLSAESKVGAGHHGAGKKKRISPAPSNGEAAQGGSSKMGGVVEQAKGPEDEGEDKIAKHAKKGLEARGEREDKTKGRDAAE